ncbi:MAG: site-2 protease family protein [Alphaproteobacteria bacterium]|nr:site-2 protease family protein [Alphaproteobacteria bacterium]
MTSIYTLTTWVIPLLLCVILHEVAHGYMALKLGDKTAWLMGRLTLDPRKHIDPIGSILVPGLLLLSGSKMLFGWAKPVPVDFNRLHHPKRDMGLVALAGPAANILLAIVFVLIWRLILAVFPHDSQMTAWMVANLRNGIGLSLVLACFNLLPVLPMDGGRIVFSLLPKKYANIYQESEKYGLFILIVVLFILPSMGLNIVGWFIGALYPLFEGLLNIFM